MKSKFTAVVWLTESGGSWVYKITLWFKGNSIATATLESTSNLYTKTQALKEARAFTKTLNARVTKLIFIGGVET